MIENCKTSLKLNVKENQRIFVAVEDSAQVNTPLEGKQSGTVEPSRGREQNCMYLQKDHY